MGEFRIGRTFARHSYPDTPRSAVAAFARNSAFGPQNGSQALPAAGAKIKWSQMEVGTAGGTAVPITPRVTGIVRVLAVVVIKNLGAAFDIMGMQFIVDGTAVGTGSFSVVDSATNGGVVAIPMNIDLDANTIPLTVGTTHTVEVEVVPILGGTQTEVLALSTIDLQELPAATG